MSEIQFFDNGEFNLQVTAVGDSFIVEAPGLARSLGSRDAANMLRSIPDKEKGYSVVSTPGGDQEAWHVTEAGFYRAMGQRQAARVKNPAIRQQVARFQSWVFGDVLPALRRGQLVASQQPVLPRDLPTALRALADEMEAHNETKQELEEKRPQAEAFSQFMESDGTFEWAAVAQILTRITGGLGRNNLLELLRSDELKVLKDNNTPYQANFEPYFLLVPGGHGVKTTRVTPRGLDWLRQRLVKHFNHQPTLFVIGEIAS